MWPQVDSIACLSFFHIFDKQIAQSGAFAILLLNDAFRFVSVSSFLLASDFVLVLSDFYFDLIFCVVNLDLNVLNLDLSVFNIYIYIYFKNKVYIIIYCGGTEAYI